MNKRTVPPVVTVIANIFLAEISTGWGGAVAMRELMRELRESGIVSGGPAQFQPKDRSRFLQSLDQIIQRVKNR